MGQDLVPVANGGQVSINKVQGRPVVQTEGIPDHDGAVSEGHLLLDCHLNKTFPTIPPDPQPAVVVVEFKARFVAKEGLSSLLTILPHVTPAEFAVSRSVCGRQAWSYCWATGTEVHSRRFLMVCLLVFMLVQLPPEGAGRGSSGL